MSECARRFLRQRVILPRLLQARRRRHQRPVEAHPKFWSGAPVPTPLAETGQSHLSSGGCEIAVRDGHRAYFEKYPFDEVTSAITGPPHYQRFFAAGTLDYVSPLDEPPGRLKDLAHAHIRRLGLLRDGAS